MAAEAGPSKFKTNGKAKAKADAAPAAAARSASVVDSDAEADSDTSADSDEIDDIPLTPARAPPPARQAGSALPRYQPPPGTEAVDVAVSFKSSPFEFENMEKGGMELWAVRIPADVKPSRLAGMTLSAEGSGSLTTKNGRYALAEADGDTGAEMNGLTLLVPRMSRGGKLVRAPVKIGRRVILKPVEGGEEAGYVPPVRGAREQPEHLLKFRNRAFGFDTKGPGVRAARDGEEGAAEVKKRKLESPRKGKDSPKKEKKRKSKA